MRNLHMRGGILLAERHLWKPVLQIVHNVPAVCRVPSVTHEQMRFLKHGSSRRHQHRQSYTLQASITQPRFVVVPL